MTRPSTTDIDTGPAQTNPAALRAASANSASSSGDIRALLHYLFALFILTLYGGRV